MTEIAQFSSLVNISQNLSPAGSQDSYLVEGGSEQPPSALLFIPRNRALSWGQCHHLGSLQMLSHCTFHSMWLACHCTFHPVWLACHRCCDL